MRYSKQREEILTVLRGCEDHPTAETVYMRVRQICPSVSLGTVYRNLRQLVEEGLAVTVETTDASLHYDGRVTAHSHFVCTCCGKIIDVFEPIAIPHSLTDSGVMLTDTKAVFYGLCPDCVNSKTN